MELPLQHILGDIFDKLHKLAEKLSYSLAGDYKKD